MNPAVDAPEQKFIYSRLAPDPDLCDIVDLFVEEMPDRIAALLTQLQSADIEGLRRTAHQLKGAAGSYGFDSISPAAARVESAIRDGEDEERLHETVQDLVSLCQCVRPGVPEKK
jgi:histidine phosphotransfer protein HptB